MDENTISELILMLFIRHICNATAQNSSFNSFLITGTNPPKIKYFVEPTFFLEVGNCNRLVKELVGLGF